MNFRWISAWQEPWQHAESSQQVQPQEEKDLEEEEVYDEAFEPCSPDSGIRRWSEDFEDTEVVARQVSFSQAPRALRRPLVSLQEATDSVAEAMRRGTGFVAAAELPDSEDEEPEVVQALKTCLVLDPRRGILVCFLQKSR